MKLPSYKRIFKTDYDKQYESLIATLALSVNAAFDALNGAMNHQVSLRDNLYASIRDFKVTVDTSGTPVQSVSVSLDNNIKRLEGISVINATPTTSGKYPTAGVFVSYSPSADGIFINNVAGLQANQEYTVRITAWGAAS